MNNSNIKGILLVSVGAASYGVLATLVGLAYKQGFSTTEVVTSQYLIGLFAISLLVIFNPKARQKTPAGSGKNLPLKLMLGGSTFGLTGFFYYLSVIYIPVSVAVVLLMQAIWMGIVAEAILSGKMPDIYKSIAVIMVLAGTLMATNAINNLHSLDIRGILWGFAAALMYTIMLLVSNKVALNMHPHKKSFFLLLGGVITVIIVGILNMPPHYDISVFWKWGLPLALFGTILPPVLFNMGMPKTGVGLGSILISIEIPVSVCMAFFLLNEEVIGLQWVGIAVIIASVVLLNIKELRD
ncbi:DMT family transporter [Flavobacterium sp. DG1-102-2]|uniref:EamA family transporter n=1 Tax=Flavobacterium sp. DG1-102-2 TaxID=3081663 RepID=UPI0029490480|nr:DMT family transporter [Flavobacterium sp. DG1-102-2]MDV6169165.1 DMT family transporter [Flavobacterium sp. DG1-102-2]